jgi:hypothetical protein
VLNRIPHQMPPLWLMLEDIGNPHPRELAKAFAVAERTARAWIKAETAPQPVLCAIFWLTRWGQSAVNADAVNDARNQYGMAEGLRREVSELRTRLDRLGRIADFGAANDPAPGVALPAAVQPPQGGAPKATAIRTEEPGATAGASGSATEWPAVATAGAQGEAC